MRALSLRSRDCLLLVQQVAAEEAGRVFNFVVRKLIFNMAGDYRQQLRDCATVTLLQEETLDIESEYLIDLKQTGKRKIKIPLESFVNMASMF